VLTFPDVVSFLLEANLVTTRAIADCDLRISDVSKRNTNYRVVSEEGRSYLLKHGIASEQGSTLANEAVFYEMIHSGLLADEKHRRKLRRFLPLSFGYFPQKGILALELLTEAKTLGEHHARTGRFSTDMARQVGQGLAYLHSLPMSHEAVLFQALSRSVHPEMPHWCLSIHWPYLRQLDTASNAAIQLITIIQSSPEFCRCLDKLSEEWRAAGYTGRAGNSAMLLTPIHCDIKWNNIIVCPKGSGGRRATSVKLIDWELARIGDPCWDIGSMFGEYLACWLLSIPVSNTEAPDHFLDQASFPLRRLRPAMRAFWSSYSYHRRLNARPEMKAAYITRSVRYSAVRLVQTAYERAQTLTQLTGSDILLLQLALNILQWPEQAMQTLLGIEPAPPQPVATVVQV
jgi:hypothetical protein